MDIPEKFEEWVIKSNQNYHYPEWMLERNSRGDYAVVRIQGAWQGYQAAAAPQVVADERAQNNPQAHTWPTEIWLQVRMPSQKNTWPMRK